MSLDRADFPRLDTEDPAPAGERLVGRLNPKQLRLLRRKVLETLATNYLDGANYEDLYELTQLAHRIDERLNIAGPPTPTLARRTMIEVERGPRIGS